MIKMFRRRARYSRVSRVVVSRSRDTEVEIVNGSFNGNGFKAAYGQVYCLFGIVQSRSRETLKLNIQSAI